jgi:alkanesulfonate monooxygenase SsuD/methylene tetrahydromethanopterin reductase-like flavin-dependent oxidoreductase (luciferase family)
MEEVPFSREAKPMKIGIGLPNSLREADAGNLIEFAKRADRAGFSTLATIDRIAFPSYETLTTLAAAAAVTSRIRLMPNILLGPTRNPVVLAKEAATVDRISGGRLVLGLAVGGRKDDFDAVGLPFGDRGKRFDRDLDLMRRAWAGERIEGIGNSIGPAPHKDERVPIMIGGTSDAAIRRAIEHGIGWTAGGSPPDQVAPFAERVRTAWKDSDRDDEPRIAALSYFSVGDQEVARRYIEDYYAFLGDFAKQMAEWIPKTPEAIVATVRAYEDVGVDELILDATVNEPDQVDKLAEIVL